MPDYPEYPGQTLQQYRRAQLKSKHKAREAEKHLKVDHVSSFTVTKPGQVPGLDPASRNMHNLGPASSRTKGPVSDDLFASMFDLKLEKKP